MEQSYLNRKETRWQENLLSRSEKRVKEMKAQNEFAIKHCLNLEKDVSEFAEINKP